MPAATRRRRSAKQLLVTAFLISAVMFGLPLPAEAHGGGPESIISFSGLVNWMHLLGTAAWLGGVIFLRLFLGPALRTLQPAQRGRVMAAVLQRYVHLAWWGIATLFFTGILTTWAHVPTPRTFTGTTYGLILSFKILLTLGMVGCTLVITLGTRGTDVDPNGQRHPSPWKRWSPLATRVNLVLTLLMLLSVASLTEFVRTPLNIFVNLLYYAGVTVWLGGLVFVPVVFGPSLRSLEDASRVRLAADVLSRFQRLAWPVAVATIAVSVLTAVRGVGGLSDLWTEGYGVANSLHILSLVAVLIIMVAARITPHDLLNRRGGDLLATFTPTLLIGALALAFFAFGGALEAPSNAAVAAQIPLAAKEGGGPSLNMLEPLGYVIAAFVTAAIIWHFAVVEQRSEREAPMDREARAEREAHERLRG